MKGKTLFSAPRAARERLLAAAPELLGGATTGSEGEGPIGKVDIRPASLRPVSCSWAVIACTKTTCAIIITNYLLVVTLQFLASKSSSVWAEASKDILRVTKTKSAGVGAIA